MKKFALCALLCMMNVTMFAQSSDGSYWCYCRIYGDYGWGSDMRCRVEFNDSKQDYFLCDKNDDGIIANTPMHLINIFAKDGWDYVDMVIVNNVRTYIMRKKVKSDDEAFTNYKLLLPDDFKRIKKEREKK
jgi:hypothetical protein